MSKVLVSFHWDVGRMGDVNGLFVTTTEELETLYGKNVYFGEILGKHSCIEGTVDRNDITIKTDDAEFIDRLVGIIGHETVSGYNPFNYIEDEEEDEDDTEEYDDEDA